MLNEWSDRSPEPRPRDARHGRLFGAAGALVMLALVAGGLALLWTLAGLW